MMKMLRVWLIVLLCSVLALPLQANTALNTTQDILQQAVSANQALPAPLFIPAETVTNPETIAELENKTAVACYELLLQLYFEGANVKPLFSGTVPAHNSNGLHTILTAGP
ncbi:hypothetical protein GWO68_07550 [Pontibacter sp. BT213]|uniref:Uncharacterized protein n=1 Tax=Pontibacter fetidus TaxID=2700082 RepID=A0A6B2GY37_9BACT|nr:hypothetical protein [Pontibacter fetidus]